MAASNRSASGRLEQLRDDYLQFGDVARWTRTHYGLANDEPVDVNCVSHPIHY